MLETIVFRRGPYDKVLFYLYRQCVLVGKDVTEALGYVNTTDALTKHVDKEDKSTVVISDGKGNPNKVVINESGFYSLITIKKEYNWGVMYS